MLHCVQVSEHVYFLISVFFFLLIFHMHGQTLQNGQSWPGRKICTFSIFVLCTALLILNPIIYYLNPSIKNLLKRSLCVYVNNTKKVSTLEKDKKKKKSLWRKRASILMPWLLQQMTSEKSVPQPSVLVALPFKLGVSLTEINVVFSALSIYLSSGCID